MTVIDLKSLLDSGHFNLKNIKEMADEYRTDSFFTNNGFSPATRIQKMCQTISRKLQGSKVFMHGSVPMYGICSTNLLRKSPRYRSMFACDAIQTLSHGNPQQSFKVNFGRVTEELLVVTRSLDENGKMKYDYYLSNAPVETPLKELARVVKAEHRVEDGLKRAKSEAGLSDYEVRTWAGWYHHQTLSLIATWFLICETRRGKKIYSGTDSTPGSHYAGYAVATRVRSQISRLADALCEAKKQTPRVGSFSPL